MIAKVSINSRTAKSMQKSIRQIVASTYIVYHVIIRVPLALFIILSITNKSVLRTNPVGML